LNCLSFYYFGLSLENNFFPEEFGPKLGKLYYILLFTGGIYAASITEYYRNKNNSSYTSLGASGAISSLLFCYIVAMPYKPIGILFMPKMPGFIFGILLLGISYYLIQQKRKGKRFDNISHESHFWGALFGIIFILILKPSIGKQFVLYVFHSF
jgi:membrane associated rhomboid family serine protease